MKEGQRAKGSLAGAALAFLPTSLPGTAPKSGVWQRNPSHALTVIESDAPPEAGITQVRYRGSYYTVRQDPWDQAAFTSLYLLLQMSEHAAPQRAFPITISK